LKDNGEAFELLGILCEIILHAVLVGIQATENASPTRGA
jgi:hypothetical protein